MAHHFGISGSIRTEHPRKAGDRNSMMACTPAKRLDQAGKEIEPSATTTEVPKL